MKKLLVLILSIFYLTVSTGATVHVHYCMDKLVDWGLQDNDKCSNCGMKAKPGNDCCKNELKQIKLHNDQKITEVSFQLVHLSSIATATPFPIFSVEQLPAIAEDFPVSHAPPVPDSQSIYIRNCVFRI